jgi:hypothetical protein
MGYFEVERTAPSEIHPDGYQLFRELNVDTGKVKRHRGFCVINRSIPVGFLRGETLNVDRAFLIKHVIQ